MTPEQTLAIFHAARKGSDKPCGILRGIKAVQEAEKQSKEEELCQLLRENMHFITHRSSYAGDTPHERVELYFGQEKLAEFSIY